MNVESQEIKEIVNTDTGATIIHTRNGHGKLLTEEIILYSGRYKITYFDENENPNYGIVKTATGSFGIIYYDQFKTPLFKFWNYGNSNTEIQVYSENFDLIGEIKIDAIDGTRNMQFETIVEKNKNKTDFKLLFLSLVIIILAVCLFSILKKSN